MLALGDQVLALLADFRSHLDLALTLGVLAETDLAVDLRDNRELLGLACFEQLRDSRQTAGDVLGLGGLARNLADHVARLYRSAFGHALGLGDVAAFVGAWRRDHAFAVTSHYDEVAVAAFQSIDRWRGDHAFVADLERGLLGAPAGVSADMEGAHRELRARLAN